MKKHITPIVWLSLVVHAISERFYPWLQALTKPALKKDDKSKKNKSGTKNDFQARTEKVDWPL